MMLSRYVEQLTHFQEGCKLGKDSRPFVSGTAMGAALGRAGKKASEIATGIASGIAVSWGSIIIKLAMMTLEGIMMASVEGFC